MKPSIFYKCLSGLHESMTPAFLSGPPGGGKTSLCEQYARSRELNYLDVRLFLHGPEDFKFPMVNLGALLIDELGKAFAPILEYMQKSKTGLPAWAKPVASHAMQGFEQLQQSRVTSEGALIRWMQSLLPTDPNWEGIIVLEELPQAAPIIQNVASPILLERRIGDYRLPEKAYVLATGNRQKDKAGANKLLSQVYDRLVHLELESNLDDWIEWALDHHIRPEVISYLRWRPTNLNNFDPARPDKSATPRGWHMVSKVVQCIPRECRLEVCKGIVGEGVAAEFIAHQELHDKLPDIDECIRKADTFVPPKSDPAICYAFVTALAQRAREGNMQTLEAIVTIANKFSSDFGVLLMKDALKLSTKLRQLPSCDAWVKKNASLIINA